MSVTTPTVNSTAAVVASPAAAAETIIAEIVNVNTQGGSDSVVLSACVSILVGTAGTSVRLRIRRGTTVAGTLVADTTALNATAADTVSASVGGTDNPGQVAGQSYVLTAQIGAATAASTVEQAQLTGIY